MTFGSLFSGVGGFDMGLEAAGWSPAWQVEIEPQAASVLRHHWPDVSLHSDVRNVGRANLAGVDIICGGFPCQDLSVAGKRAGLAGERSGLFHEFMRVVDELAPRWVLIENVPGLLSSNGGRDMGTVLGVLGRLGYGWTYRCLDTQFFGPPQRRLRVFIVGCAGGFCPPEVLLEPEGLPWNPAPSREARKDVAGTLGGRAAGEGGSRVDLDTHGAYPLAVAGTLASSGAGTARTGNQRTEAEMLVAHTLRSEGADASEDGTGRGTPLVCDTLVSNGDAHSGFRDERGITLSFNWQSGGDVRQDVRQDVNGALHVGQTPAVWAFDPGQSANPKATHQASLEHAPPLPAGQGAAGRMAVTMAIPRRLTPRECERLQGWPDDWTRYGRKEDGTVVEVSDSARYRMAGNGVSAPVAEWIGRRLMQTRRSE